MFQLINKNRNREGFTLIELIIVISILGILTTLALPRLIGSRDTARIRAHNTNVKTLKSAANIAVAEHGAPDTVVIWDKNLSASGLPDGYEPTKYIDEWPDNPLPKSHAQYGEYKVTIDMEGRATVDPNGIEDQENN